MKLVGTRKAGSRTEEYERMGKYEAAERHMVSS